MKTDARVKYTKMVLKKALLELMQHKPVNKITVKEICERAELNRATFYAHYSDCFDLLESMRRNCLGSSNDPCRAIHVRLILRGLWVGFTGSFRKTRRSAVSCCSGVAARS